MDSGSVRLTGLTPETSYTCKAVFSYNKPTSSDSGFLAESEEKTFTTTKSPEAVDLGLSDDAAHSVLGGK